MADYGPATYGDRIAEVYDEWYPDLDRDAAVELLAELAGSGPVLELGVGTGRLALPLQERGLEVHGVDASTAMVAKLRAKSGGERITVTVGDLADVDVDGEYPLVFIAFNTLFALLRQEDQVRCFANVARVLSSGGAFLVHAFVPDLGRFDRGQRISVNYLADREVRLEVSRHDATHQRVDSYHIVLAEAGTRFYPVKVRYAWPAELDLMARLAGLRLHERFAGWNREPFGPDSGVHISVYGLAED